MNKYKINIASYFKTTLVAMLLGALFTGVIIYFAQRDVIERASTAYNDKMLKQYIKKIVIAQNEELSNEHPDDYRIQIHLGYLHRVIQEYDKAESYYKKAVSKMPLGVYKPLYELTNFYIEQKRYEEAYDQLEKFPYSNKANVLTYLSKLYEKFGDVYFQDKQYYNSVKEYKNALSFREKLTKSTKHLKRINRKLYDSSIVLADKYMNNDMPEEATVFLETALKAKPNDFNAQYKIAIANVNLDTEKSYYYFKKLFKRDAYKVDYKIYKALMEKMAYEYEMNGDYTNAKLFRFRAKDLVSNVAENIMYPSDVEFKITKKSLYRKNKKCKILYQFDLKNLSNISIKTLKMKTIYKIGDKVFEEYEKDILMPGCSILSGDTFNDIGVVPKKERIYKKEEIPQINIEVYLYKKDPKKAFCAYKGYLFEEKAVEVKNPHHHVDYGAYIKFFANQVLNLGTSFKSYKDSLK